MPGPEVSRNTRQGRGETCVKFEETMRKQEQQMTDLTDKSDDTTPEFWGRQTSNLRSPDPKSGVARTPNLGSWILVQRYRLAGVLAGVHCPWWVHTYLPTLHGLDQWMCRCLEGRYPSSTRYPLVPRRRP